MSDEARPQVVQRTATAPILVSGAIAMPAPVLDETTINQEMQRCASALGPGFSVIMMFAAALLIGSGVAVEWALPNFEALPASIALGCFFGALTLALYARSRFQRALTARALLLGLPEHDAKARARVALRTWGVVNQSDSEG